MYAANALEAFKEFSLIFSIIGKRYESALDNLYSQTQDLYGISPNHFIQQIADQVPIVGKTLAIAEGEGRNILYLANKAKQQNDSFSAEIWDYSKVAQPYLQSPKAGFDLHLEILISMMSNGQESVIKM
jgi:hypothetical protein